jgi:SnoaL-like domain
MEERLQWLVDRAEVSDTIMRYFLALDRFDVDAVRATVADEFTLDAGALAAPPSPMPVDQFLEELVARNWGFAGTIHINPNHLIEIDGDAAHVTAYMFGSHIVGDAAEDCFWGYGIYSIDLVRTDAGWRMTRLKIEPVRTEGGDAGRIFAIAAQRQGNGKGH